MSALEVFTAAGGEISTPAMILDASIPLELSGEAVRGRICTFTDETGREWALRPDLTLPIALAEVERRKTQSAGVSTHAYSGPVFRLPSLASEPIEYAQVGFERFGADSTPDIDAETFSTVCAACQSEGVSAGQTWIGDLAVFPAFVDALDIPEEGRKGLKRAFRQAGGIDAFLSGQSDGAASGLAKRMRGMDRDEVAAFVEDIFALTGIRPVGERSGDEVVERLYQRATNGHGVGLKPETRAILETVLAVRGPAEDAADQLYTIALDADLLSAQNTVLRLKATIAQMQESQPGFMAEAQFATTFGRRFTYYDGLVFEISEPGNPESVARPFAAGGRYDSLLSDLSNGTVSATAVGGIVVPHRLKRVAGAAS
ncbi:MAG: ATP phosphoribosyltransferase regulatory subunit [Henriciella sp.]|nr:ATP phosphoribosyltransferase regulatory subunit [Henriciella sp.]